MKFSGVLACVVVVAFALAQEHVARAADANPPEWMTYQGYLVDSGSPPVPLGNTAPVNYKVVFRIYNAKKDGTPIWTEQQTVTVDKGYFSVLLGEGAVHNSEDRGPLSVVFDGEDASDRFIGITVDIGGIPTAIEPRLRLVTSPFAYTATQARRLTDGSGNRNFFKEGSTLKLGSGSTPTLTLPEAGGATLSGKLTADLPSWGAGLQIDNGSLRTTLGADNSSFFHFNTQLPKFHFNKTIYIGGDVRSYNRDTVLGPSDNTDTYLKIHSGSNDIHAYADNFYFRGGHDFRVALGANTELLTDAPSFYMNKPLTLNGVLTASDLNLSGWIGRTAHNNGALVGAYNHLSGAAQASNPIYIIGTNYKPNSTSLGNMYGIGYTDYTASFITGTASGWGLYVAAAGDARTFLSGTQGKNSYINKDGGYVGIGTDSPSQALDVNGNLKLRGGAIVGSGNQYLVIEDYNSSPGFSHWGVTIRPHANNYGSIGTSGLEWDDGYITELWAAVQGSDRRIKKDITPVQKNELLEMIDEMSFYQYRLRFSRKEKMKRQGRDADGVFYGLLAQELREVYPNVVKSSGLAAELDENEEDEEKIQENHWYVEKARLAELALGGIKDLHALSKDQEAEIDSLKTRNRELETEMETLQDEVALLKASLVNQDAQEGRIAKLEELVSKIGQGQ